jgi:hypothetical protein
MQGGWFEVFASFGRGRGSDGKGDGWRNTETF